MSFEETDHAQAPDGFDFKDNSLFQNHASAFHSRFRLPGIRGNAIGLEGDNSGVLIASPEYTDSYAMSFFVRVSHFPERSSFLWGCSSSHWSVSDDRRLISPQGVPSTKRLSKNKWVRIEHIVKMPERYQLTYIDGELSHIDWEAIALDGDLFFRAENNLALSLDELNVWELRSAFTVRGLSSQPHPFPKRQTNSRSVRHPPRDSTKVQSTPPPSLFGPAHTPVNPHSPFLDEFGATSLFSFSASTRDDTVRTVIWQPDGKILAAGRARDGHLFHEYVGLARFHPDGTVDTSFDGDGVVTNYIHMGYAYAHSIQMTTDGKIVALGRHWSGFQPDGRGYNFILLRYNSDGSRDSAFDNDGLYHLDIALGADFGRSLAIQTDGKLIVGGYAEIGTHYDFAIARFSSDGVLDGGFGTSGIATTPIGSTHDVAYSLTIDTTGRYVMAGYSHNGTNNDFAVVRYLTTGVLDTAFSSDGIDTWAIAAGDDRAYAVGVNSTGDIVATGRTHDGANFNVGVARIDEDGTHDESGSFAVGTAADIGRAIFVDNQQRSLIAGRTYDGSDWDFALLRVLGGAVWNVDPSFGTSGAVTTPIGTSDATAYAVALTTDSKIVVAGRSGSAANFNFAIARYLTNGVLDTSFSSDGSVTVDFASDHDLAYGIAVQPNNDRIVVGGGVYSNSDQDFALVRFLTTGVLDSSFSGDGQVTTTIGTRGEVINGLVIQTDGDIVAVGFSRSATDNEFAVARYLADGNLDSSFSNDGVVTTDINDDDEATAVALQADGDIVVTGLSFSGTSKQVAVTRYLATGILDTSFANDGVATTTFAGTSDDTPQSVLIQTDGKIVVGGRSHNATDMTFALTRFDADGILDSSFDGDGKVTTAIHTEGSEIHGISLLSDGKIAAVGSDLSRESQFHVALYESDGNLYTAFFTDGVYNADLNSAHDMAYAIVSPTESKLIIAGVGQATHESFQLLQLIRSAGLDPTFSSDGVVTTAIGTAEDTGLALAVDGGKIVVGGRTYNGSFYDMGIVRYQPTGALAAGGDLDLNFSDDGKATHNINADEDHAYSVVVTAERAILMAGSTDNGTNLDFALVRLTSDGSVDTTFSSDGEVTTALGSNGEAINEIVIQTDGKFVVAGYSHDGTDNNFAVARYLTDGSLDSSFSNDGMVTSDIGANDNANAMAIDASGRIVLTGSSASGTNLRLAVARYTAAGVLDTAFDSDGVALLTHAGSSDDTGYAVAIQTDGKVVVGGQAHNATITGFAVSRFDADGAVDSTFSADGVVTTVFDTISGAQINDLVIQASGRIVAAGKTLGRENDFVLAGYTTDGALDSTFSSDGLLTVAINSTGDIAYAMAIASNEKIVVAGHTYVSTTHDYAIARLTVDGALDTSFGNDGIVVTDGPTTQDNSAYAVTFSPDGMIVVAGSYWNGSNFDFIVHRYWP